MKMAGSGVVIINSNNQVLLILRDNKSSIPFPNTWTLPGGHAEEGESSLECVVRETEEELGITCNNLQLFYQCIYDSEGGTVDLFWTKRNLNIEKLDLKEGQCAKWFSENEVKRLPLAFKTGEIITEFFKQRPYEKLKVA